MDIQTSRQAGQPGLPAPRELHQTPARRRLVATGGMPAPGPTPWVQVKAGSAHAFLGDVEAAAGEFAPILQVGPPQRCLPKHKPNLLAGQPLWQCHSHAACAECAARRLSHPCPSARFVVLWLHPSPRCPRCRPPPTPSPPSPSTTQEPVESFADLYLDAGHVLMAVGHPDRALPFLRCRRKQGAGGTVGCLAQQAQQAPVGRYSRAACAHPQAAVSLQHASACCADCHPGQPPLATVPAAPWLSTQRRAARTLGHAWRCATARWATQKLR
jgi:hypothetical protein